STLYCVVIYMFFILTSFILILLLFTHPAPTEIYTLSLHDALPISQMCIGGSAALARALISAVTESGGEIRLQTTPRRILVKNGRDRKSTRLNSSHVSISYAVFCLKKKKKKKTQSYSIEL